MQRLFWTTEDLLKRGFQRTDIDGRVDNGLLVPLRKGLWAESTAPPELIRVARAGGAATATTASAALGLWTPPDERTHIAVPGSTGRLHDPDVPSRPFTPDEHLLVHRSKRNPSPLTLPDRILPLLLVLEHAVRCLRPEYAVAIIDSALHERRIRKADLAVLAAALPAQLRGIIRYVDGRADSGLESIARYLLVMAGFAVQVHPLIPGVGEVDLLIAGRLIIETDGKLVHIERQFVIDRDRDRAAALLGYRVLRLSYRQVMYEWAVSFDAVCAALA